MGSKEETATAPDEPSKTETAASSAPPSSLSSSSSAVTPQPFFPTSSLRGTQHPMPPPYGTPIAYFPIYPHEAMYAQPSMAMAVGVAYPTAEPSDAKKNKGSASKGSSANAGGSPGKSGDGGKLNDFRFREGVTAEQQHLMEDEGELKRERRRQSNRESAKRSRLRRRQEREKIARKVVELKAEKGALTSVLEKIKKSCMELAAENESLEAGLIRIYGADVASSLGIGVETSAVTAVGADSNDHAHQSPVRDSNDHALQSPVRDSKRNTSVRHSKNHAHQSPVPDSNQNTETQKPCSSKSSAWFQSNTETGTGDSSDHM